MSIIIQTIILISIFIVDCESILCYAGNDPNYEVMNCQTVSGDYCVKFTASNGIGTTIRACDSFNYACAAIGNNCANNQLYNAIGGGGYGHLCCCNSGLCNSANNNPTAIMTIIMMSTILIVIGRVIM